MFIILRNWDRFHYVNNTALPLIILNWFKLKLKWFSCLSGYLPLLAAVLINYEWPFVTTRHLDKTGNRSSLKFNNVFFLSSSIQKVGLWFKHNSNLALTLLTRLFFRKTFDVLKLIFCMRLLWKCLWINEIQK